jgi:hypothetical protein
MDTNEINMKHLNKNKSDILLNYLGVFLDSQKTSNNIKGFEKVFLERICLECK